MAIPIGNIGTNANVDSNPLDVIFSSYGAEINRLGAYLPAGVAAGAATAAATASTLPIRDANGAFTVGGLSLVVSGVAEGGIGITGIASQTAAYVNILASTSGNNGLGGTVFVIAADKSTTAGGLFTAAAGAVLTAPSSGVSGSVVKGASGDPTQFIFRVTKNDGTSDLAEIDNKGQGNFYGGLFALAQSTSAIAVRALSADNTAGRKVFSAQTLAATEGAYITNDGAALFGGRVTHTTEIALVEEALPAGVAGQTLIAADSATHSVKFNQNNTGWVTVGSAAAAGANGAMQYTSGSGVFVADANNFFVDNTNKRFGINLGASPTLVSALDMAGAINLRSMVLPAVSAGGSALLAMDSGTNLLKASVNGSVFSSLLYASTAASQSMAVTGAGNGITFTATAPAIGTTVNGDLIVTSGGAIRSQGTAASFVIYDRGSNSNYVVMSRNATDYFLGTSENGGGAVWDVTAATGAVRFGGSTAPNAMVHVMQPAVGTVGFLATGIASATADIARLDTSAVTNGIIEKWDFAGRRYQAQGTAPAISAGAGAGGTPTVVTVTGTDYEGTIAITTGGTTPTGSNALIATITFRNAFGVAPKAVQITPASTNAGNLTGTSTAFAGVPSTTAWNLSSGSVALANSTAYVFAYRLLV